MSTATLELEKPSLKKWIAERLGVPVPELTREALEHHQLKALHETLAWARERSSFYAQRLAPLPCNPLPSLREICHLPLTTPADLARQSHGFLCVPQDEISRIVTLSSSGTGGAPKRVFFTAADQKLTLDFFAHGVAGMASRGDRMLIALPGEREGSVGYQLAKGISRAGVIPIAHGLSLDPGETLAHMEHEKATCIIGLPVQMLALARRDTALADSVFRRLRCVVLCSDHVSESIVHALRLRFDGEVFEHYGSTEMGLGGGVDCEAHAGYHLREADLYFEIVSPETGEPAPDGEIGEVVFTTLHRRGMPLIRYRTGDLSRLLPGPCSCGSILRRLEKVRNRIDGNVSLGTSGTIGISTLDDALFAVPGLLDFSATLFQGAPPLLQLAVHAPRIAVPNFNTTILDALHTIPAIRDCSACGELELIVVQTPKELTHPGAKRKIEVHAAR